jgi:hypothetical protein
MVKMDFLAFLERTENYILPPAIHLGVFPTEIAEKIECFRGLKTCSVDVNTFQKFVYAIGAYESLQGDMWKGRSVHFMRAIAEEIILQREAGHLQLTPDNLMGCFTLGWVIEACSNRPAPISRLSTALGDLPGAWINGRFSPSANGLSVFNFLMEGGLKYWRLVEAFQKASYRQIPLMIGGGVTVEGVVGSRSGAGSPL